MNETDLMFPNLQIFAGFKIATSNNKPAEKLNFYAWPNS